ncbi:polysaccharide biosynthesis tyrosine autokinase [Ignavibacterium sp.]|uniref:GumC family protein n=1 Tax=Ignavibacterium sp. TaxID=2651167 RepID=UPI00260803E4|nr:polysaccharide biosynthesis tyrosine autokinase [Ignavibacterium sp.]
MEQNKNNEEYIPLRFSSKNVPKREKTLIEIFQIIARNKKILFATVGVFLVAALIYSFTATPIYETSATLKKEGNPNDRRLGSGTDISTLLSLQSTDEIETELELIKTFKVASEVAKELDLFVNVKEIKWNSNDKNYEVNKTFVEMSDPSFISKNSRKFRIPEKFKIKFNRTEDLISGDFSIVKKNVDKYELIDLLSGKKISESTIEKPKYDGISLLDTIPGFTIKRDTAAIFILPINEDVKIEFRWDQAPEKSELIFSINDINSIAMGVSGGIKVSRLGKTNIFNLGYSSRSAYAATVITNTFVNKYREARMEQKKETIRYSYNTVDKQLLEIQDKLREAEEILSNFKASGQIMTIDASSQNLIGYLSRLEAEKMNIDLQLSDYKNRVADLKSQINKTGYFDQSYLGPTTTADNSAFSELMRQLSTLELQRIELLQKRTENHPDVKAIDEQIQVVKEKLSSFNQNTITAYEILINTLEKKLLRINDMMSKYEAKLQSLPAQENKLAQILRQKATYEKIFTILLDQREAMRVAELSSPQDISIVDLAKMPNRPSWPKKQMIVMISILLGSFTGILIIFLLELRKSKFIILDELEEEFKIPILSLIPKLSKEVIKAVENNPEHKVALLTVQDDGLKETYRVLKTKLFQNINPETKLLMITSCEEDSGKTTVATNLAASLAQEGKRVLLIDCDLRKGDLSGLFGLSKETKGLLDYLLNDSPPKIYTRASKNIDIIPSGGLSSDSGTLLDSARMRLLFRSLDTTQYDLIIVDTPPVTRVVDPLVLSHSLHNAIVVVRPEHSLLETVRWGISELLNAKISVKGLVINAADIENSYYYKHRYGYGYGYGSKNGNGKAKDAKKIKQEFQLKFKDQLTHKN